MANSSNKINLAVIFGGENSEHEVSRMSVTSILENLSEEKYNVYMFGITKGGKWLLYSGEISKIIDGSWEKDENNVPAFISPDSSIGGAVVLREGASEIIKIDCIFPVLHGKKGEDGTIQGLFEMSGIPYVGCDTTSSAVCMDKAISHSLLAAANIKQAYYLWFYADRFEAAPDTIKNKITARLTFPVFVKPANAGSSVGVSRVDKAEDLDTAIRKAAKEDKKIMVEQGINGHEVECAVMGNRNDVKASVVGEIGASADFYDYDDKYVSGTSVTYIPAKIDDEISEEIRRIAIKAYRLLGCSGLSRVDFFVDENNEIILNEINTLPGFTPISMYPKLWVASGMPYPEILDNLIELALTK